MRNKLLPVFIIIIIFLIKPVFSQHTYYVSKNGKDSNNGLSISNSFLTLQKAANMVSTGDSVIVKVDSNYLKLALYDARGTMFCDRIKNDILPKVKHPVLPELSRTIMILGLAV